MRYHGFYHFHVSLDFQISDYFIDFLNFNFFLKLLMYMAGFVIWLKNDSVSFSTHLFTKHNF